MQSTKRHRRTLLGAVPTLAQLRREGCPWVRIYCRNPACGHSGALALVPIMIRWGGETSTDRLRGCARCTRCGHKGAVIQRPSWVDLNVGFEPFPSQ